MARITVNTDEAVALGVQAKAKQLDRSESAYIETLIKADLRAAGLLPEDDADVDAQFETLVIAGLRKNPATKPKIAKLLRLDEGKRRVAAAASR